MHGAVTRSILAALGIIFLTSCMQLRQIPPDLVMFNGRVFTSNTAQPHVEAVAIPPLGLLCVARRANSLAVIEITNTDGPLKS